MLRIFQNSHASGAKSYFTTSDSNYYDTESVGHWWGKGAELLGLSGVIQKNDWDMMCDNLNPGNGQSLTQRTASNRTVGYDFNFHAPKSLSLLYAFTHDEAIRSAFRQSVYETMHDIELDTEVRVRKAGMMTDRKASNLVFGEYVHETARPVEGVSDPHLHIHCFTFNAAHDPVENEWKAVQFRGIKESAPYYQAVFHARLAKRIQELGYATERTRDAWEVSGISDSLRQKFSNRTHLIESLAREKEITNAEEKAALGAKTREKKQKDLSPLELMQKWMLRLSLEDRHQLAQVSNKVHPVNFADDAARKAASFAIEHCFVRSAVVTERTLIAEALKQGVGQVSKEQIDFELDHQGVLRKDYKGKRLATTREILALEQNMILQARLGRGQCEPLCPMQHPISRDFLNADQRNAVRHIWESRDKVIQIRGAAGVGKTTLLLEAREGIEAQGKKIFVFAPTVNASREGLRSEGFENADTIAKLLLDQKLQQAIEGQVVMVDEAALSGTRDLARVVDLANKKSARLILVGDVRQHKAVQHGTGMRLLETEAGLIPAEVKEIQRQKAEYKVAVAAFSEGQTDKGLDILQELNWIIEDDSDDRYRRLAKDYVDQFEKGKKVLASSPTHAEIALVTDAIRSELRERQLIGSEEHNFTILKNLNLTDAQKTDRLCYEPGLVIRFCRNVKGHKSGERIMVNDPSQVPIEHAKHFQVYRQASLSVSKGDMIRLSAGDITVDGKHLNNGTIYKVKDFTSEGNIVLSNNAVLDGTKGLFDSSWCQTSYAIQGKTTEHTVFIAQSALSLAATSQEQLYVSASRSKEKVLIYTDSLEALREAASRGDARMAATDLWKMDTSPDIGTKFKRMQKLRLITRRISNKLLGNRVERDIPEQHRRMEVGK